MVIEIKTGTAACGYRAMVKTQFEIVSTAYALVGVKKIGAAEIREWIFS
jgi:hypothetical protein